MLDLQRGTLIKGEGWILTESGPTVVGKGNKGVDVQICVAK